MTTLLCALFAATVYRLELENETPYIVGEDGVRREVCIVEPAEYALMTGRVDQVWRSLNSTADGRRSLHGAPTATAITNGVKVVTYKDGYRHSEQFEKRTKKNVETFKRNVTERNTRIYSERQRKFREALEARRNAKPKEVTVEHNAATGKDIVK